MTLRTFLENICIDEEWRVQYYTSDNANMVVVFDTAKDVTITEEELVKQYGDRWVETIFIDSVRHWGKDYPQIVLEIE